MKIKTGIKVFVFLGAILTFSGSAFAKPTLRISEFSQKTTQQKKNLENKFKDARERGWPLKDKMLKDQNQKDDRQRNQNQKDKNQKDLKNDKQNQNKNKKTADDTSVIRTSSKTVSASDFELSIIAEVNLMRSNPRDYAEKYIKPLINSRSSSYWTSCVRDMSAISSLGTLEYAEGLYKMAKAHSSTQGKTRETGHDRTNGSDFSSELSTSTFSSFCTAKYSAAVRAISGTSRRSTAGSSVVFMKPMIRSMAPAFEKTFLKYR